MKTKVEVYQFAKLVRARCARCNRRLSPESKWKWTRWKQCRECREKDRLRAEKRRRDDKRIIEEGRANV